MALAGNVRLSTFLLGAALLVAIPLGMAAGMVTWRTTTMVSLDEQLPPPVKTIQPPGQRRTAAKNPSEVELRPMDELIISTVSKPIAGGKIKDLTPDRPYKINVYQDEGEPTPNRLKVDLDRDDKWDEKWTMRDGYVRKVAPNDDEEYTQEFYWTGTGWRDMHGNATPAPEPGSAQPTGVDGAPVGHGLIADTVFAWMNKTIAATKMKDVTRGHPFKVNVYQDAGHEVVNRAKVDLDRDDKWDEKWTFDGARVTREVAPADDESFTKVSVWTQESGWVDE